MRACRAIYSSILLVLLCSLATQAGTNYHALIIRSVEPLDSILVEKFKINGKDKFYRLEGSTPLTKNQYKRLRKFSYSEIYSMRVERGPLRVRTNSNLAVAALPENFKNWPKGSLETAQIVLGSRIKAKILNTKRSFSTPLVAGWIIYLFPHQPPDDTIAFALAEAQNSERAWVEFVQRFPGSPHARTAREHLAPIYTERAQQALSQFQDAFHERKPGYGNLGEARQWLNRLRSLRVGTPEGNEVAAEISQAESDINQRLQDARSLAESSQFKAALQTLEPLVHFREEFAELATTQEEIVLQATRNHLDQSRQRLAQAEFEEALRELDLAASYREEPAIPALREEIQRQRVEYEQQQEIRQALAQAQESKRRNDFGGAFEALWPTAQRYPNDGTLQQEFYEVQRVYRETLLAEVAEVESLHAPVKGSADEEVLLRFRQDLARLDQRDSLPALQVWRDRLSLHLAEYYRQRATEIADRDDSELDALGFAYLQQAQRFILNKADLTEFPMRQQQLEDELRIRLALNFRDLTPGASGEYILAELATLMAGAIQEAGFPHVDIVEVRRGETPELTLELVVELLRAAVRDTDTSQPVASEYSSGFRQVPNPAWRDAKTAYDQAVENYERVRARVEQNRRKKKYEKKERQADEEALRRAQDELKKSSDVLDSVPSFVEEEDVRPYEFVRRNWTRMAEIRLGYRWVNVLTGVREAQEILEERTSGSSEEVAGAHPADKQGHRNQRPDLPEAASLRGAALRKIQQRLAERVLDLLGSFVGRDFERAQGEAERGNNEVAAEYYLRFLYNSAPDDPRRPLAATYLQSEFRLTSLASWVPLARED